MDGGQLNGGRTAGEGQGNGGGNGRGEARGGRGTAVQAAGLFKGGQGCVSGGLDMAS